MDGIGFAKGLRARLAGWVPAATVDAYLRAGGAVYDDLAAAETLRRDLARDGADLWSLSAGQSSQLLATWCAFALQSLGEELVECERAANPHASGYLPAMTAEQASVFLIAAGTWSQRARRASADPGYDLASEMRLPAPLPAWDTGESCPRTHMEAMVAATGALRERAQAAFADFAGTPVPAEHQAAAEWLHGLYAQVDAAAGRALELWTPSRDQPLHRAVKDALRDALDQVFRFGQVLARPALLDRAREPETPGMPIPLLPGEAGFDPWCLSAPAAVQSLHRDPDVLRALEHMWRGDPDPAATVALFEQVEQAVAEGSVDRSDEVGYYDCTPWPAIYTTRRRVTLAGRDLVPGQQFTLDICVGVDGRNGQDGFHRGLLVADFKPSHGIEYCDQDTTRHRGSC